MGPMRPTPRCPWCSAALPPGAHEPCPSCGATLNSPTGTEPDIKGVTALDPRRSSGRGPRSRGRATGSCRSSPARRPASGEPGQPGVPRAPRPGRASRDAPARDRGGARGPRGGDRRAQDRRGRGAGHPALAARRRRRRPRPAAMPDDEAAEVQASPPSAAGRRGRGGRAPLCPPPAPAPVAAAAPADWRRRTAAPASATAGLRRRGSPGLTPVRLARILGSCPTASRLPAPRTCASRRSASAIAVSAGMAKPVDGPDDWWLAVLWVTDADGVVSFRDVAPAAGPPPSRPSRGWARRSPAPCPGSSARRTGGSRSASRRSSRPTTTPGRGAARSRSARRSAGSPRSPRRCGPNQLAERCWRRSAAPSRGSPALSRSRPSRSGRRRAA